MGWGLVAASRGKLLEPCTLHEDPPKCDFTVYDMCSESRRMACGKGARSPFAIATSICRAAWKRTEKCLVLMFDDPSRMHAMREVLHKKRYKPLTQEQIDIGLSKGKVEVNGALYLPDMVPYTKKEIKKLTIRSPVVWPRLWASSEGKKKAFRLIQDACIVWHHQNGSEAQLFVIRGPGKRHYYPYCSKEAAEICDLVHQDNFGEADQMLAEAAKALAPRGSLFLQTIDTDMILQMIVTWSVSEDSRVWVRLMNETICAQDLVAMFGGASVEHRLTACFFLIACNGTDYTKGLTSFGFYTNSLSELATTSAPIFSVEGGTATLNTHALVTQLGRTRLRNVKSQTWEGFNSEIHNILFTISLFSGACKDRQPAGGPDLTDGVLVQGPEDAYSVKHLGIIDISACTNAQIQIG